MVTQCPGKDLFIGLSRSCRGSRAEALAALPGACHVPSSLGRILKVKSNSQEAMLGLLGALVSPIACSKLLPALHVCLGLLSLMCPFPYGRILLPRRWGGTPRRHVGSEELVFMDPMHGLYFDRALPPEPGAHAFFFFWAQGSGALS